MGELLNSETMNSARAQGPMASSMSPPLTARTNAVPIDPSLTSFYVHEFYVGNYIAFCAVTLIVYSALTTLDKEVHFFWRKPLNFVALIFFSNRYVGLAGAISNIILGGFHVTEETCRVAVWIYGLCSSTSILLIDYILLLRVAALYSPNKKLASILRVLFALEVASLLGITSYLAASTNPTPGSLPVGIVLCTDNNGLPPILGALLLGIPLVYGSVLMVLALYKVLIQDQAIYFLMVLFCTVANIIAAASDISPFSSFTLEAVASPTFLCVVGNHLVIHLKEAVDQGLNEGTSYRPKTLTSMNFKQGASAETSETTSRTDVEMRGITSAASEVTTAIS